MVRVAVIGAGLMGADHARIVVEEMPGASLQVVCDMDEVRARKVADAHGAADVAATHDQETMLRPPVPIWPGTHLYENLVTVLTEGYKSRPGSVPLIVTLINSMVMALGVAIGKILISIISAFAIV